MARGGFDFSEMEALARRFQVALDTRVVERFIQEFVLEMAYRAERKIKRRTPVDKGQLRRAWTVGQVQRRGNSYVVEIINNTEYASFVEYGHRTGKYLTGWVEGRFMMTVSMKEIERELPRLLERKQHELIEQIMNERGGGGR